MLKTLLSTLIAIAVTTSVSAARPEQYYRSEHHVAMRDGVKLFTVVYAPGNRPEKSPILLMRTPYNCSPGGYGIDGFLNAQIYQPYVEAGYIFAFQDVRGRWMSEGDGENVRPLSASPGGVDDSTDAYDTIEWLVDSVPDNNGRVGVYGNSYCGYYSLTAAASRHPALRAASPQAPVCDWYIGDDFHHNGAFALMDAIFFAPYLATEKNHQPSAIKPLMAGLVKDDRRQYFLSHTLADIEKELNGRVVFLDSIYQHPNYDEFWVKRNTEQFTHNLTTPMLVVGGHFDAEDLYGTLNTFRMLRKNSPGLPVTLTMGPWSHGQWRSEGDANTLGPATFSEDNLALYYRDQIEFPFFEYYLRDKGEEPKDDRLFITGENRWWKGQRELINTVPYSLYLRADSTITNTAPNVDKAFLRYVSDPNNPVPFLADENYNRSAEYMTSGQQFLQGRKDLLTYSSPVLADSICFVGTVTPKLFVSLSTTDADFIVKIIDEAPDGSEMLVRGDIFRGRYRNGFDNPLPYVPGQVEKVEFQMNDIAHTFLPGHKIKVQIQSSWFPLFDMNPQQFVDIYHCSRNDFIPSEIKIYSDKNYPSQIIFNRADTL